MGECHKLIITDVLWCNGMSCFYLCLMMEMTGPTGNDVKRAFTS